MSQYYQTQPENKGQPQYGQPMYGQPMQYGQAYGAAPSQAYGAPPTQGYGAPPPSQGYGQAPYSTQPVYGQPVYGQPVYSSQPVYGQSTSNPSSNDKLFGTPPPDIVAPQLKDGMFKAQPKFNDLWAAILFIVHWVAFAVVAAVYISYLVAHKNDNPSSGNSTTMDSKTLSWYLKSLGASTGVGVVATFLYMVLVYKFPEGMIIGTFFTTIALYAAVSIYGFLSGVIGLGILFAIFSILHVIIYFFCRKRIPLAAVLLKTVVDITSKYPKLFILPVVSIIFGVGYNVLAVLTLVGAQMKAENEKPDSQRTASVPFLLYVFVAFSFYWSIGVVKNVGHVTIAGVFATFYFLEGSGQAIRNPVSASLKRAMTYSFGSICFGSLLVALIQTLRAILRASKSDNGFINACIDCILGLLEGLVEYFNMYAYTQIAIYGKPYIQAAKDTWRLVKSHGVDAVVNDNLIGIVLSLGIVLVALLTGFTGFIISYSRVNDSHLVLITVLSVLIGLLFMAITTEVINSGMVTTFVCLCEDPQALQRTKPQLYGKIIETCPEIVLR